MTAIDNWITELQQNKSSARVENLISKIDTVVAALQFIAAGLAPAGAEAANTFYAGPAAGVPALPAFRALVNADFPAALTPTITSITLTGSGSVLAPVAGQVTIGNAIVGAWSVAANFAIFQNSALAQVAGNECLLQQDDGTTFLNSAGGKDIRFLIGGVVVGSFAGATGSLTLGAFVLTVGTATLIASSVALTNNAGVGAGTLTNAPAAGNPTKWIPINDNGTVRNIPAW